MDDEDRRPRHDPPKRDPRADPDDVPSGSRVDVVNVDRTDGLATAANTLRRDLARLQQQAAVVERTLEDHRKQQSDALERLERATEHALELQARLQQSQLDVESWRKQHDAAVAELQSVRGERDDLERAIEAAKAAALDIGRMREDAEKAKEAREELEKSISTLEGELATSRKKEKESTAKAANLASELEHAAEREKTRDAKAQGLEGDLNRATEKAKELEGRIASLTADLSTAQTKDNDSTIRIASLTADLSTLEDKHKETEGKIASLTTEVAAEREKEQTSSLRATTMASELGALREKEKDANARATKAENELAALREKFERTNTDLVSAQQAAAQGKMESLRAREDANEARDAVARLKNELESERALTKAEIARVERRAEETMSVLQSDLDSAKRELDETRTDVTRANRDLDTIRAERDALATSLEESKIATKNAEARVIVAERARALVEEGIRQLRSEITAAFGRVRAIAPSTPPPGEKRASVMPPNRLGQSGKGTSFPPVTAEAPPLSIPSPARTGVRAEDRVDDGWSPPPPAPSRPPPLPKKPPSIRAPSGSIPPVYYPSIPPAPLAMSPDGETSDVAVVGRVTAPSELFELLFDPETARDAVEVLREHPEWLNGPPPSELVGALAHVDYDAEGPVFELARAWEREALCSALIAALKRETDPRLREHGAWLLKHLGAPSAWTAIAELAMNENEPLMVRRWLLEALDRLAAGRVIGWRELGDSVEKLTKHPDPSLRDGAVGVLMSFEKSDDKRRVLLDILREDNDEVVLASAVHALASVLPVDLDPVVIERLLSHPSARVQRSVKELIERSKKS